MNTKLHAICDSNGRPISFFVSAGQVSDYIGARALLSSLPDVDWLLGDRGYDADWFREALQDKGIRACIPGRKQRKTTVKYDKRRNRIEIMFGRALLRKSADDRTPPFPGHIYPAATVIGIPSAVKRLRTAARIWTSATWRSKSRDINRWPSCFTQFIFVSTLLRRWYPLQLRQSARPKCFDARRISFRARAPAVSGFQGLACRLGGMIAAASRSSMRLSQGSTEYMP